jgi:hypothetical protein
MEPVPMSEYEQEQVRLKDRELTLEHRKSWVTLTTVIVSVAAALLTYWGTRQGQLEQSRVQMELQEKAARNAFELKAAEIAMSGRGSFDAKGRAKALAALFPGRLPPELGSAFDPAENSSGRDSKSELLALLAAASNPEHRRAIVRAYKALLPEDDSIKRLPPDF